MTQKNLKRLYFKTARKEFDMPYYMAVKFSSWRRHNEGLLSEFVESIGGVVISSQEHHCYSCDCDYTVDVYQMPDGGLFEVDDHNFMMYRHE